MTLSAVIVLICALVLIGISVAAFRNEQGWRKWLTAWLLIAWFAVVVAVVFF